MKIESMTGYGSAVKGDFRVEIRSVNHKNIDINFNGPSYLYRLDPEIRKLTKKSFSRGRIDIYVSKNSNVQKKIKVNKKLAMEYRNAVISLKNELCIKDDISLDFFTSIRDIFSIEESEVKSSDFTGVFDSALKKLKASRVIEGKKLITDISKRILLIRKHLVKIKGRRKIFASNAGKNLQKRLKDILHDTPVDQTRLIQESAILIERSDITEEIVRIKSHLDYMKSIIISGGVVGKKLDFVVQELRREVNTTGSKSADMQITVSVVEMKDELEKIKEQVQNIQ